MIFLPLVSPAPQLVMEGILSRGRAAGDPQLGALSNWLENRVQTWGSPQTTDKKGVLESGVGRTEPPSKGPLDPS